MTATNLSPRIRMLGVLLLGFCWISIGILVWLPGIDGRSFNYHGPVARSLTLPQVVEVPVSPEKANLADCAPAAAPGSNKPAGYESLGAALAAARHAVEKMDPAMLQARGARYFAANPGQRLRAWFSNDGVELASGMATPAGDEPWCLKVRLVATGRDGAMMPVSQGSTTGEGARVEMIYHDPAVSQWFENRQDGIEHGFTLTQAPAGGAGEVVVLLGIEGSLRAVAMAEGVRFVDAGGAEVVHYGGLKAWDAEGHALAASLETRGPMGLALVIADAGARYPITVDPMFANVEARLVERSVAQDYFGSAVALSGDTAVIGAPLEDTLGHADAGSAYVFVRMANNWRLQAKLSASDLAEGDYFGDAVAISGDTVVVGADWADAGGKTAAGKTYIFTRSGVVWSQQAILTASDAAAGDHFGAAVAVSGDTVAVGAPFDDTSAGDAAGSAYVFARSGTAWVQQAHLAAYDAAGGDQFGSAVAVDGGTVVVGAPGDDSGLLADAGSAYVYARSGTAWNFESRLLAPVAAAGDGFGCAVAVSGNTAVVGAKGADTSAGADAGSAHVYLRSGVVWNLQATLLLDGAAAGDGFGSVVALDGDTAVIGAPGHAANGIAGSGSAAVFSRSGDMWNEQALLAAGDPAAGDSFGAAVAVSAGTALVGALGASTEAGLAAGSAWVFVNSGTAWNPQAELLAENSPAWDLFGVSVALAGDTAIIGAFNDNTPAGVAAGSAYVFVRDGMLWAQEAKLTAGNGAAGDAFGASVAISGDTAIIGASGADTPGGVDAGSVSVFARSGTGWVEQQVLMANDGAAGDHFGSSLALDGDTALIGAAAADTPAGTDAGSAYIFRLSGGSWQQEQQLLADDAAAGDGFGGAVALDGDTALVGASRSNTTAGIDAGQAYVFTRSGVIWSQQARLGAPDGATDDRFGAAVTLSNNTALVGAPYDTGPGGLQAGSAHVFVRTGVNWSAQAKLTASDAAPGEEFGFAVSLDGDTALVGAPLANLPAGSHAGASYVFARNGTVWSEQLKLTSGVDASAGDQFGNSVAVSGGTALVAAYADATAGPGAGSAYIWLLGELPVITQQPQAKTVMPGQAVTFTVVATGYQPLRYQWRKNGYPLDNAAGPGYMIASAQVADQGNYDCVVSNLGGVVTSASAVLVVNALSQLSQSFPAAPQDTLGYVMMTLTPSGVGSWRFLGEQQWRPSDYPAGALTPGNRQIEFRPVSGYIQPPVETVSVTGGSVTRFQGDYYQSAVSGSGGLNVILKPDSLTDSGLPVAQRAQWRIFGEDDSQWRDSGATAGGLMAGIYLMECKPLSGMTAPGLTSVTVEDHVTATRTLTYVPELAALGTAAAVLPAETVSGSTGMPYGYVGQIRSNVGSSTGFVVKQRVVATAGHVVFDDVTLAAVTDLQWLFQRDRGSYEPQPLEPRGFYLFTGYSEQRAAEKTPGISSPQSQELDVAAIYFNKDAGRGGFSGFLASDAVDNEFLRSSANKILVGYPVDGIAADYQGRMHATPAANVAFAHGGSAHTYITSAIHSSGGASGGPMCVQSDGGNYYPAAIYLGGSGQTVVRSIDSGVIDIFNRAEVSGNGGGNNTGGGITHTGITPTDPTAKTGNIKVSLEPATAAAVIAGGGWRLKSDSSYRLSGSQRSGLSPGTYILQFTTVSGFQVPSEQTVEIVAAKLTEITFTYAENIAPPVITSAAWAEGQRGQTFNYQIVASPSPASYTLTGSLPAGLTLDPNTGLLSGTPQEAGVFTVTLGATNAGGTGTMVFTIACKPAVPNQNTTVSPGQPMIWQIASSESGAGVVFAASGLPQGLAVDASSGRITGTSQQLGVFPCLITVSKRGASTAAILTITAAATPLDSWRMTHFGTYANTGTAADTADPDHDGQNNLAECAAGTNPNNPADVLKVLTTQRAGTTFALTVSGKAGRTYALQRSADLTTGDWTTITTIGPLAADTTVPLTDQSAPVGMSFYRIQVSVP